MASVRISDTMRKRQTLSFEVFPPKTDRGMAKLTEVIKELGTWKPDYISCTYGAGGSNVGKNREVLRMAAEVATPCTHFTCIGHTKETVKEQLQEYLDSGIEHVLALRGDLPFGWTGTGGDFQYATDLVHFIRTEFGDRFEIGVAGTPDGHVACRSLDSDIAFLRRKQDEGADYIITQLCFDMEQFKIWHDKIRKAGITLPIDAGIMPVVSRKGLLNQCFSHNACAVPRKLAMVLTHNWFDTDPDGEEIPGVKEAFREEGLEYTVDLIHEYIAEGVDGIHLYAMNKSKDVEEIIKRAGLR